MRPAAEPSSTAIAKVGTFTAARYDKMLAAIRECHTVDDCMEAQRVAESMAVYFKQANDDEAFHKLREIRLRAWRRMSDIIATVNVSKCQTQKAMITKVREELGADATACLTDSRIIQLIKLAGVPEANFERDLGKCNGSMDAMYRNGHPASIAERVQNQKAATEWEAKKSERETSAERAAVDQAKRQAAEADKRTDDLIAKVKSGAIVEAPEVGLTLTPKAKANLVEFSIMMDRKMHDQLRDAAHERRTTMWAILREASNYWFVVNGYEKV